jgi:hypothetical protein
VGEERRLMRRRKMILTRVRMKRSRSRLAVGLSRGLRRVSTALFLCIHIGLLCGLLWRARNEGMEKLTRTSIRFQLGNPKCLLPSRDCVRYSACTGSADRQAAIPRACLDYRGWSWILKSFAYLRGCTSDRFRKGTFHEWRVAVCSY